MAGPAADSSPGMTTSYRASAIACCKREIKLDQLPLGQVLHQRTDAKRQRLAFVAGPHPVDELAELRGGDGDDVVALVGEPLPRRVAILARREHRAEEQHESVRILMHLAD